MTSTSFSLRSPASFPFPSATGACGRVRWTQPLAPKPFRAPLPPAATPAVSRRLLVPAAAGIWDFISGGAGGAAAATLAVRRGMQLFKQGDVAGSVAEFDRAIELDPRQKAYLWQRGLSLYYLDRFEDAAEQFRLDVAENPNDTEESIWCFLCEAPLYGVEEARKRFLEVGLDRRPVMREAYALFKDGGDPEKLASSFSSSSDGELFYASLYTRLYYESQPSNRFPSHQTHPSPPDTPHGDGTSRRTVLTSSTRSCPARVHLVLGRRGGRCHDDMAEPVAEAGPKRSHSQAAAGVQAVAALQCS